MSSVEASFVKRSKLSYASERVCTIEVDNVYELGKLTALRFLEWCLVNPDGNIALPTGRTPEYFIKTLEYYKTGWSTPQVQAELKALGYPQEHLSTFPHTANLSFFMLDEFFPMLPSHRNSFCKYVKTFYCDSLGIREENIHTFDLVENEVLTEDELKELTRLSAIDLTLLTREPVTQEETSVKEKLVKVVLFCEAYEEQLCKKGGIGFFLGGLGPDGHVAFNQQGTSLHSRTRLVNFNYMSAAAAAGDLGGIEFARGKAAMTIGMGTITENPDATIVIMAAGEGKATVVRDAIELEPSPERPASALHAHKGARFYVTGGAAQKLQSRLAAKVRGVSSSKVLEYAVQHQERAKEKKFAAHLAEPSEEYQLVETLLYQAALRAKTTVRTLSLSDLMVLPEANSLPDSLTDPSALETLKECADQRLREKIQGGLAASEPNRTKILHTAPHHDDIMLSYHPAMHEMLNEAARKNENHFAYLTSGFHSVNDSFLHKHVHCIRGEGKDYALLREIVDANEIFCEYDLLLKDFRVAFLGNDKEAEDRVESAIFVRKVFEVFVGGAAELFVGGETLFEAIQAEVEWVRVEYLEKHKPGDSLPVKIQLLKGAMRESEVDRVWALSNLDVKRVHHLRSKFYTDDFFNQMPSVEEDAVPMAKLTTSIQPHVLSVAFDPEGTGPDTHYKVLALVAAALRLALEQNELVNPPIVWGYRNVWFVFTPADATLFIPASKDNLERMHRTFMSCFTTQKAASFPSPHYDGPFSLWSRSIQENQARDLRILLGEPYFTEHPDPRVRNCAGFIFIKAMYADRFLKEVEELKSKFETKST